MYICHVSPNYRATFISDQNHRQKAKPTENTDEEVKTLPDNQSKRNLCELIEHKVYE